MLLFILCIFSAGCSGIEFLLRPPDITIVTSQEEKILYVTKAIRWSFSSGSGQDSIKELLAKQESEEIPIVAAGDWIQIQLPQVPQMEFQLLEFDGVKK